MLILCFITLFILLLEGSSRNCKACLRDRENEDAKDVHYSCVTTEKEHISMLYRSGTRYLQKLRPQQ